MKQKWHNRVLSVVCFLGLLFVACKGAPKPDAKIPKDAQKVEEGCKVNSILFTTLQENGKVDTDSFKEAKGFLKEYDGSYYLNEEDVKTAHLVVRVDIDKPQGNDDFKIKISNENSYLEPVEFERKKGGVFASDKNVILSKGENKILVKITAPSGKEAVYKFVAKYGGGPSETTEKRRVIPGVYCPTQRKASAGETEELLWAVYISSG